MSDLKVTCLWDSEKLFAFALLRCASSASALRDLSMIHAQDRPQQLRNEPILAILLLSAFLDLKLSLLPQNYVFLLSVNVMHTGCVG